MSDALPCYANRVVVFQDDIKTENKCKDTINKALKAWGKKGIVVFSVTERDGDVSTFLKVALTYKNAGYCSTRSKYHGNYRCYMVLIPCNGGE